MKNFLKRACTFYLGNWWLPPTAILLLFGTFYFLGNDLLEPRDFPEKIVKDVRHLELLADYGLVFLFTAFMAWLGSLCRYFSNNRHIKNLGNFFAIFFLINFFMSIVQIVQMIILIPYIRANDYASF